MKIFELFNAIDKVLNAFLRPASIVLSLFVAVALTFGICARIVMGTPMFGLEELVLIAVVWLYMVGAILASRERSHLSADFILVLTKNQKVIAGFHLLSSLISLVMAVLFVTWSYDLFVWAIHKKQVTPVFSLPWYISQGSLLFAAIFFVYYIIRDVAHDLMKLLGKECKESEQEDNCFDTNEQLSAKGDC